MFFRQNDIATYCFNDILLRQRNNRNTNRNNERTRIRKRPSQMEKGVSSYGREPFLASKKRPLHLQIVVFYFRIFARKGAV